MSFTLRLPPKVYPPTSTLALRNARNDLRSPLKRLASLLSTYPDPECFETDPLLGYSAHDLKEHLETLFNEKTSWDNSQMWFLDHIVPVHHYIMNGVIDPKTVNALKNLKPEVDLVRERTGFDAQLHQERKRKAAREFMAAYSKLDKSRAYRREFARKYRAKQKAKNQPPKAITPIADPNKQTCLFCKETKSLSEFRPPVKGRTTPGITCLSCLEKRKQERQALKPPKKPKAQGTKIKAQSPKTPEPEPKTQEHGTKSIELLCLCNVCKEEKDISEFHADNSRPSGVSRYCKRCTQIKREQKEDRKFDQQNTHFGFC